MLSEKNLVTKNIFVYLFTFKRKKNRNISFENLFYIDKSKVLNEKENRRIGKEKKS